MIFGSKSQFALEAIVEPGPEFPPLLGASVAGRVCLYFQGHEIGDFLEPYCVLGPVSDHLVELCSSMEKLWHPSLTGLSPEGQFAFLDHALFLDDFAEESIALQPSIFLTNSSEAFDDVKGFLIAPPGEPLRALLMLCGQDPILHFSVTQSEFCAVANQFRSWVDQQELALAGSGT